MNDNATSRLTGGFRTPILVGFSGAEGMFRANQSSRHEWSLGMQTNQDYLHQLVADLEAVGPMTRRSIFERAVHIALDQIPKEVRYNDLFVRSFEVRLNQSYRTTMELCGMRFGPLAKWTRLTQVLELFDLRHHRALLDRYELSENAVPQKPVEQMS